MSRSTDTERPLASASGDIDLLTPAQTARRLRVKIGTLAKWRSLGRGPRFVRLTDHGRIAYRPVDVRDWLSRHVYASTAEADQAAA
jgi:hypothetical protein